MKVSSLFALLLAAACLLPGSALAAPTLSWSDPVPADLSGGTPSAIGCASHALCVAVDESGHVLASGTPASGGPSSWRQVAADSTHALTSVSCAAVGLCAAVDDSGRALVSTGPATAGSWAVRSIDGTTRLTSVSCPLESLCVATDQSGNVLTSGKPASAPWGLSAIDPGHALQSVSCSSAQLCVAVDDAGRVLASAEPLGGVKAWLQRAIATDALVGVSCAALGSCVALDGSGYAYASANPTSPTPTWSSTVIDALGVPSGVSCGAFEVCVAVDRAGDARASEDATAAVPSWSVSHPDAGAALLGVSCAVDGFCAAIDSAGRVVSTTVPAPPSGEPPPAPPLVTPHPAIVGVPAVDSRLECEAGVPSGTPATLAYAWVRDGVAIAGASAAVYRVAPADATHHLQCLVTATNAAGSVTGHSAFVAIPAQGVLAAVDETSVGRAGSHGARVGVTVRCSPRAARACAIALRLTIVRTVKRRHLILPLGSSSTRLTPGQRSRVYVSLNALGRRMLAHAKHLTVQLSVSGTVIGVLKASLSRQSVTLSFAGRGRSAMLPLVATGPVARRSLATGTVAARAGVLGAVPLRTPAATAGRSIAAGPLAPTPYMGWDTYFAFGPRYSESTVLSQASALLSTGLAHRGYRYVWLDVGWWQGQRASDGEIAVNPQQWPHGMSWLASTLHSAGLLAGLYTDAGIEGCGGRHQGSFGHYRQDADTFAAWGFDAVKVDFCGGVRMHLDPARAYSSFHGALQSNSTHRPLLLSICDFLEPGEFHGEPGFGGSAFSSYTFGPSTGNSWRTDTDVGSPGRVPFATVLRNLDADAAHPEAAGPGHWNDPDYLGPDQGLTPAQFRTQLSMWAMLAAPLMVSDDLQSMSSAARSALSDREVLAIDQDPAGIQATLVSSGEQGQVWDKPLSDGSRAVGLLNRTATPLWIETSAAAVGMGAAPRYLVRDVWGHTSSESSGALRYEVPGDSTVLLRLSIPRGSPGSARGGAR